MTTFVSYLMCSCEQKSNMSVEVTNLDHLGLVAGIIDEIGIEGKINELLGENPGEKVSAGQAIKAMILNGLGLVSSPLYLFGKFFEGKATEHLIGEGVKAEYLNDDRLGRVLDKLYKTGLDQIFVLIVIEVMKKYQLNVETTHLDSSSFHVHGEYETGSVSSEELEEPQVIKITYGYSLLPQTRSQAIYDGFNLHFRWGRAVMDENRLGKRIRSKTICKGDDRF